MVTLSHMPEAGGCPAVTRILLVDDRPIFRVHDRQILFYCWRIPTRIKPMNPKQFGRPIVEPGSIEGPATHMRKPLSLP